MGYNVYITRARRAFDNRSREIADSEWQRLVADDPTLEMEEGGGVVWKTHPQGPVTCFYWDSGNVTVKNPDRDMLGKCIEIAKCLRGRVQGDDGETYLTPNQPPVPYRPTLLEKLSGMLDRLRPRKAPPRPPFPFAVGERAWHILRHQECTVVRLNPGILETVTVRFDDGKELTFATAASGLEPLPRRS